MKCGVLYKFPLANDAASACFRKFCHYADACLSQVMKCPG